MSTHGNQLQRYLYWVRYSQIICGVHTIWSQIQQEEVDVVTVIPDVRCKITVASTTKGNQC